MLTPPVRPEFVIERKKVGTIGDVARPLSLWERLTNLAFVRRLVIITILALAWELYARWINNPLMLPTFTSVCSSLWEEVVSGPLIDRTLTTIQVLLIGYGVGVVLSVLAHFIEKFVREAGLGFFDRVGGGALGFVTGACVVLAMLLTIVMFFGKDAPVAQAAEKSQSWKYGKQVVGALGDTAPAPIRRLLGLLPDEPEGTGPRAPGVDGRLSPEPVPPRDGLGAPVDASTRREPGTTPQRPPR